MSRSRSMVSMMSMLEELDDLEPKKKPIIIEEPVTIQR